MKNNPLSLRRSWPWYGLAVVVALCGWFEVGYLNRVEIPVEVQSYFEQDLTSKSVEAVSCAFGFSDRNGGPELNYAEMDTKSRVKLEAAKCFQWYRAFSREERVQFDERFKVYCLQYSDRYPSLVGGDPDEAWGRLQRKKEK